MSAGVVADLCTGLLDYLEAGLADAGIAVPDRRLVSHGPPVEEVTDSGACTEQLAVYWTTIGSTLAPLAQDGPGAPVQRADPGTSFVVIVAELARCAPVPGRGRRLPTVSDLIDAATMSARDGWALAQLMRRSPKKAPTMFGAGTTACDVRRVGSTVPFGPRGGVQGVACEVVTAVDLTLWSTP